MFAVDRLSENYLLTRAMATQKPPAEFISAMVQKELAAAL